MAANLTFLTGFIYAVIELLKSGLKSFGILADDNQRTFVVRILAVIVGVGACLALQVDVLHSAAPTLAGMVITGAALAVASDLLQVGTDLGNAKAKQIAAPPSATTTSVKLEAKTESVPPIISSPEGR